MSQNDITGDRLVSKSASKEYLENYDNIFKLPQKEAEAEPEEMEIVFEMDFDLGSDEEDDIGC